MIFKTLTTLKTHWKKSIVFAGISLYGVKYADGKYRFVCVISGVETERYYGILDDAFYSKDSVTNNATKQMSYNYPP